MMRLSFFGLALAAAASPISADDQPRAACEDNNARLYVASYSGGIKTLEYTSNDGKLSLTKNGTECNPAAVWLELDKANKVLFCSEETNGGLYSFKQEEDGSLTKLASADVVYAPVSSTLFNNDGNRGIALANYANDSTGGPGLTTLSAPLTGDKLEILHYIDLSKEKGSNANPARQATPHPHQVLLDPTGGFILTPDLGSDMIRFLSIDKSNNNITQVGQIAATPGSGPRHGIFYSPKGTDNYDKANPLYYILTHELDNTLVVYKVTYPTEGQPIWFEQVFDTNTFGGNAPPAGALASEVQIYGKFLYAANRLDMSLRIPPLGSDPKGEATMLSDSIAVFEITDEGHLKFLTLTSAGGVNPRHFSINKAGDLAAVGLSNNNTVVLLKRDVNTGILGDPAAWTDVMAPTTVIFDE
ncbi:putative isomerase YbhE [Pseudovirgaria hyperparasitica]|uniref:Putative isomerase YbhE n=1 Tax=Pseudovirgaria hyperparasitica TaxID=470096 RepID=A0A6A6W5X4_9PEZI|nr:putative isomerase YbhE [Pseudovirgaria hyperparasitica]KAF2757569.1 putative isomerase YbhE [Pseudovirgaria hyperparasitica]